MWTNSTSWCIACWPHRRSVQVPSRCSIQVAVDGKTLRGTIPRGSTRGVHLLAAYCPTEGVVLFQVAVSNSYSTLLSSIPMLAVVKTS